MIATETSITASGFDQGYFGFHNLQKLAAEYCEKARYKAIFAKMNVHNRGHGKFAFSAGIVHNR